MRELVNQEYRKERFEEEVSTNDCVWENGMDYPTGFPRYLVVEKTSGEIPWFYLADSLEECAQLIDSSDTECETAHIVDLDADPNDNLIIPIIQVSAFIVSGVGRIERHGGVPCVNSAGNQNAVGGMGGLKLSS